MKSTLKPCTRDTAGSAQRHQILVFTACAGECPRMRTGPICAYWVCPSMDPLPYTRAPSAQRQDAQPRPSARTPCLALLQLLHPLPSLSLYAVATRIIAEVFPELTTTIRLRTIGLRMAPSRRAACLRPTRAWRSSWTPSASKLARAPARTTILRSTAKSTATPTTLSITAIRSQTRRGPPIPSSSLSTMMGPRAAR